MDIWVISIFWLFGIMLWTFLHKFLFVSLFSILLCIHLGVEQWLHHFIVLPAMCEGFHFFTCSPTLIYFPLKNFFFFNDHRSGYGWASLVAQRLKRLPAMRETWVQSLGQNDPLEKEMATHSSTLAWRIPWTEEPGRLQSTGSQRVGHDWVTSLSIVGMKWFLVVVLICIFHDD